MWKKNQVELSVSKLLDLNTFPQSTALSVEKIISIIKGKSSQNTYDVTCRLFQARLLQITSGSARSVTCDEGREVRQLLVVVPHQESDIVPHLESDTGQAGGTSPLGIRRLKFLETPKPSQSKGKTPATKRYGMESQRPYRHFPVVLRYWIKLLLSQKYTKLDMLCSKQFGHSWTWP